VTDIQVNGLDGADSLVIYNSWRPIVFNGGNGNDTLTLTGGDLGHITAQVTFNGGAGTDAASLNDNIEMSTRLTASAATLLIATASGISCTIPPWRRCCSTPDSRATRSTQHAFGGATDQRQWQHRSDYMYVDMNGPQGRSLSTAAAGRASIRFSSAITTSSAPPRTRLPLRQFPAQAAASATATWNLFSFKHGLRVGNL